MTTTDKQTIPTTSRERRLQSLAWHRGVEEGIRWAQGRAEGPLSDPYERGDLDMVEAGE